MPNVYMRSICVCNGLSGFQLPEMGDFRRSVPHSLSEISDAMAAIQLGL